MFDLNNLTALELDALNELGNIGVAHAASAFSKAINQPVRINVIRTVITNLEEAANLLGGVNTQGLCAETTALGGIIDKFFFIVKEEDACNIATMLEGKIYSRVSQINQKLFQNIISKVNAYYIEAVSKSLDFYLFPLQTVLLAGSLTEIMNKALSGFNTAEPALAFLIEAQFIVSLSTITGNFLLISRKQATEQMLVALKTRSFRK